jgi:uncharacterized protein YwgA
MDKGKRSAVLISLIDTLQRKGSWCGETHVQKTAFFLQELLSIPLEYNYILYKHGPFSFDLKEDLADLRSDSILKLEPHPPYGPSIDLDVRSAQIKDRYPKTIKKHSAKISFIVDKIGASNVKDLERFATALYIEKQYPECKTLQKKVDKLLELKPHVSFDDAKDSVHFVLSLTKELSQKELAAVM